MRVKENPPILFQDCQVIAATHLPVEVSQEPMTKAHNRIESRMFFDDCPVCQAMKKLDPEGAWHWHYDDGGYPLIAEYDSAGWDARWAEDEADLMKMASIPTFRLRIYPTCEHQERITHRRSWV